MIDIFTTAEAFMDSYRGRFEKNLKIFKFLIFSKYPIYHPPNTKQCRAGSKISGSARLEFLLVFGSFITILTKIKLPSVPLLCQKWWESSQKPKICSLPHPPGKSPLRNFHRKFLSLSLTTGLFLPINYFHVRIQEKLHF